MSTFAIRYPADQIDRAMDQLGVRAPRAIARALNRAVVSARTVMQRGIASDLRLKVGVVREQLKIQNARPEALTARLSVSGARIPLIDFNARQLKRSGVRAKLPPPGKGKYPHAFIATMRSGHRGVFQRRTRGPGSTRLPIDELHGPSLPAVFAKMTPKAIAAGEASLMKNMEHELAFELSQRA